MADPMLAFQGILHERLIPEYCEGDFLKSRPAEFKPTPLHFGAEDARYFGMAWEAGLISHVGGGKYNAPRNAAAEKFFNAGPRSQFPRTFRLAQEAVITVAVLAKLHFDHDWPRQLLGTQSEDYAFDAMAFLPGAVGENIACEVKKTPAEVEKLVRYMQAFCAQDTLLLDGGTGQLTGEKLNAFRKVVALRKRRAPIFWAVGPNGLSKVFLVAYQPDGMELIPTDERALNYPGT